MGRTQRQSKKQGESKMNKEQLKIKKRQKAYHDWSNSKQTVNDLLEYTQTILKIDYKDD